MKNQSRIAVTAVTCVGLQMLAVAATAQSNAGPANSSDTGPSQEQPAGGALPPEVGTIAVPEGAPANDKSPDATELDNVVVTASKRNESIQKVGSAVYAVTDEQLKKISATKLTDFANFLPGLSYSSNGAGSNILVVRGITTGSQTSGTVGLVVDEIPVGSPTNFAGGAFATDLFPYDISHVELLSGPQGTLYGANSLGGLLKYVTWAPDLGGMQAEINPGLSNTRPGGTNSTYRGLLNVPVIGDVLGVRVDVVGRKDAGFIDNPDRGLKNVDAARNTGGRASALWQVLPSTSLQLNYFRQKIHRGAPVVADRDSHTHEPVQGAYDQSFSVDQPFDSPFTMYAGVLKSDFGWADFVSASGWQELGITQPHDVTKLIYALFGAPMPPGGDTFAADFQTGTRKFTQELRLTSVARQSVDWQAGIFISNEFSLNHARTRDTNTSDGTLNGTEIYDSTLWSHYGERAGFADATVHIWNRFDTTLGYRQGKESLRYTQAGKGLFVSSTMPDTVMVANANHSGTVRNYLINPKFQLTTNSLIYARVATGYRPGGPNFVASGLTGTPNGPPSFGPDSTVSYEIGHKGSYLRHRLDIDLSAYRINWKNIQVLRITANGSSIENAGNARVNGAELSVNGRLGEGWRPGLTVSLTDARLVEGDPSLGAQPHAPLPLSPRASAAAFCDYALPTFGAWESTVGTSYRFVGHRPAGFDGSGSLPQYWMSKYGLLEIHAGLKRGAVDAALFVHNPTNVLGELSADASDTVYDPNSPVHVAPTEPRTIGLELRAAFGL